MSTSDPTRPTAERSPTTVPALGLSPLEDLEALYRHAPVGLCVIDRELRFVRVNEWLARLHGRSVEEHVGRTVEEMVPAGIRPIAGALGRQVLATGRAIDGFEARDPSTGRSYLVNCQPLARGDRVEGLVVVVQEITALKSAEQEARARLAELELVTAHAPVALAHLDRDLRYVWVNPILAHLNGRSPQAHVGAHVAEVVPEFAQHLLPMLRRVLETGQPVQDLVIEGRPPGDPRYGYWLAHFHPLRGADGRVEGIVAAIEDATRLKRAEKVLRAQRRHLTRAQSVAGVGSWEWNLVEDRVWWSEELYRILGKDPSRFRPTFDDLFELVHPDDRTALRAQLDRILQTGGSSTVLCRAFRDDGSLVPIRATAELDRASDGQPLRLLGTTEDLTGREGEGPPRP